MKFYGGFSFAQNSLDEYWNHMGNYNFWIPRFELFKTPENSGLAVHISKADLQTNIIKHLIASLEELNFNFETEYRRVPQIISRQDTPVWDEWLDLLKKVDLGTREHLEKKNKNLEKIVLSRRTIFDFNVKIRPVALIKHLQDRTPGCQHFCFQIDHHKAFLGATPERLFLQKGKKLFSEALAGSRPRGFDKKEDIIFEQELINSKKDNNEHAFVVEAIENILQLVTNKHIKKKSMSPLKLKEIQHLLTIFEGDLKSNINAAQLLKFFHPTPAVGGTPNNLALKTIEKIEPFKRGWFASPIGFFGTQESEFYVGIRSGLVFENKLILYAGAGLVQESKAGEEWIEIEKKINRFMKVFEK